MGFGGVCWLQRSEFALGGWLDFVLHCSWVTDVIIGALMWVNNNTMGNCLKLVLNWLQSFSAATLIISGKKLREVKHIAEGGYGFVTLVQDTETRRLYAMKKMICQTPEQRIMYQQ